MRQFLELYIATIIGFQDPELLQEKQKDINAKITFIYEKASEDHDIVIADTKNVANVSEKAAVSQDLNELNEIAKSIQEDDISFDDQIPDDATPQKNIAEITLADIGIVASDPKPQIVPEVVEKTSPILLDQNENSKTKKAANKVGGDIALSNSAVFPDTSEDAIMPNDKLSEAILPTSNTQPAAPELVPDLPQAELANLTENDAEKQNSVNNDADHKQISKPTQKKETELAALPQNNQQDNVAQKPVSEQTPVANVAALPDQNIAQTDNVASAKKTSSAENLEDVTQVTLAKGNSELDEKVKGQNLKIKQDDSQIVISYEGDKADKEASAQLETNIFDLDNSEFKIEDISKALEEDDSKEQDKVAENKQNAEVAPKKTIKEKLAEKLHHKKEEKRAEFEQEKLAETKKQDKTLSLELTEEQKREVQVTRNFTRLAAKLDPKLKPGEGYNVQNLPATINRKYYSVLNPHLNPVFFLEEYYQMLFVAVEKGDLDAIIAITKKVGVVDNATLALQTPLVYAITSDRVESLVMLLKLGYNPNQRDGAKNMPIHVAVKENRIDFVTELLRYGANPALPDSDLKVPVTMAIEQGNMQLAKLLQKAGARYGQLARNFNKNSEHYQNYKKD